jgi:hypothetical protein
MKHSNISDPAIYQCSSFYGGKIELISSTIIHPSTNSFLFEVKMNGNLILRAVKIISNCHDLGNFDDANLIKKRSVTLNGKACKNLTLDRNVKNYYSNLKCVSCQQLSDGVYLNPCLHRPFCLKCFDKSLLGNECVICGLSVSGTLETELIESDETYPICSMNTASIILLNCQHRFCLECIQNWKNSQGAGCMICRGNDSIWTVLPKYQFQ